MQKHITKVGQELLELIEEHVKMSENEKQGQIETKIATINAEIRHANHQALKARLVESRERYKINSYKV